jgi:hypothetical protein
VEYTSPQLPAEHPPYAQSSLPTPANAETAPSPSFQTTTFPALGMERRCRAGRTTIVGLDFARMGLRSGRGSPCQGRIDIRAGLMFLSLGLEVMIYCQLRLEFALDNISVFMDSQEGDGISTICIEAKEPVFLLLVRRRITAMLLVSKASWISRVLFDEQKCRCKLHAIRLC